MIEGIGSIQKRSTSVSIGQENNKADTVYANKY